MQLVGSETGQSLQLVPMDEVRPLRGGVFIPDMIAAIVARYRFQSTSPRTEANQPLKFEIGLMKSGGLMIPISGLDIYNDGFVMNTRNTDDFDVVMDDFITWASHTFNLREPRTWLPRRYQSRIIVDLERPAGDIFIVNFAALNAIVRGAFGIEESLEPQITFGPHPAGELPMTRTWVFQPRIGQPHSPNRYFSAAPLQTGTHFQMLCDLEAAAASR